MEWRLWRMKLQRHATKILYHSRNRNPLTHATKLLRDHALIYLFTQILCDSTTISAIWTAWHGSWAAKLSISEFWQV